MTITVREATDADTEAVIEVAEAAWYAAYGGPLDPATIAAALAEYYDPELVEAGIDHDAISFYIAEIDGVVFGFASAEQTWADEVELHTIYVHPDRWGEGIGSALVERVSEWAQRRGVDRIVCGVLAANTIGLGFFESMGFERGRPGDVDIAGERHPEFEFERRL